MSGRDLADSTFGDISRFLVFRRNHDNANQKPDETGNGQQFELRSATRTEDEAIPDTTEVSSIEIESSLDKWSGPESIDDSDSWGASEIGAVGPQANKDYSEICGEGATIANMNGTIDGQNGTPVNDSSSFINSYGEHNLADGTFYEISLVDEIAEAADKDLPSENENSSLVEDNLHNADTNSKDQGSISSSIADNDQHARGKNENTQDSESGLVDRFLLDAYNNKTDENGRADSNSDILDRSKEYLDSMSIHENEDDEDTNPANGNDRDTDKHFIDDGIQDADSITSGDNVGDTNSTTRFKKRNNNKDVDDESVNIFPIYEPVSSSSGENREEVSIDVEHDELSIRDVDTNEEWTALEVWSCFAMIAGVLPYWISNDGRATNLHKTILNKIWFTLSMILYVIEIANVIPKMAENFQEKPNGSTFCLLAKDFSYGIFLIMSIWASIFKEQNLIKANNSALLLPHWKCSKRNAAIMFVFLLLFATLNTSFYVLNQVKVLSGFGVVDINEIMEDLECIGKMYLTLSTECTISDFLSVTNIVWGLIGLILTAHEIVTKTAISLGIVITCGILLYTTFDFDGLEAPEADRMFAHVTQAELNNISSLAENISRFIGEVLIGYLIMNATASTLVFYNVFNGGILVFIAGVLDNGTIFVGMLLGSVAALRINWLTDEISSRENTYPPHARPGTAVLVNFIRDMAFRKTIGIGFPGVFVINFKTTFSYIGAIGALIALKN